jgi:LacI family transcriptional regulator
MAKTPSLSDVAKAAGVSPATVSRYLNHSITLPNDTIARIDEAVAALKYRPNPHARSLGRGRSDMVGLVMPDISNPFFAKLAGAVEIAADQKGLGVMLCATFNRQARELDYIDRLRQNFVDGLLFATNHVDDGALAASINESAGVVLVDEDVAGTDVAKVFADNKQGGALAAQHLIEAGHRRLAYIGGPRGLMSARERAVGFRKVVRQAGPGADVVVESFGAYTADHGRAAMTRLLDKDADVTAVFAGSDEILIGMLEVMRARDLRVGERLSIVTFDDAEPLYLLDPPITAVRQPIGEMGRIAVEKMLGVLDQPQSANTVRLPVELIVRHSVNTPRSRRRA